MPYNLCHQNSPHNEMIHICWPKVVAVSQLVSADNIFLQTAALLFSEYICLAIMSFPYSYSVLGLVPGLILTVVQAAFVLYTSLVVWYVR
jgi:hypothetical protein